MKIHKLTSDYINANVFILEKNNKCLIIDCGVSLEEVEKVVENREVVGILLTHGHYDHSRFCLKYSKRFNCKIFASKYITKMIKDPEAIYSPNGEIISDFSNFVLFSKDVDFKLVDFKINAYYCPGHSICSACYMIDENLFAGDVLFNKGIGRTDLKYSDTKDMLDTLLKLNKLTFKTVYSGHGQESNFSEQQRNISVFIKFLKRHK